MNRIKTRTTAIVMIASIIMSMLPTAAFAEESLQIKVLSSHSAMYESATCWVNVNAEINGANDDDNVTFFLTDSKNGKETDLVSEETIVSCAFSELPAKQPEVVMGGSKNLGFKIRNIVAGHYYIGCCITKGENKTYAYKDFIVYDSISSFASAYKDKLVTHYRNDLLWSGSEYAGLSKNTGNETGIDWEAWIFSALGYSTDSSLLMGSDGSTYLDYVESAVSDNSSLTIKDYFRYITALAACGEDPRSFRGENLVAGMMTKAAKQNLVASAGSIDLLSLSYFILACRIADVTEEEGFSADDQKTCYEALINDYAKTIGTGDRTKYINADNYAMSVLPLCFNVDDTVLQAKLNAAKDQLVSVFSEEYMYANGAIEYGRPSTDNTRFGYANSDSMAVFINTLILMGYTASDFEASKWQKEYGSLITSFITQLLDNGGAVYGDIENRMATYQTLGALVDLYNGKSCFEIAHEKYQQNYPKYFTDEYGKLDIKSVASIHDQQYTGKAISPKVEVTGEQYTPSGITERILEEGLDYTVEYKNNVEPGEATAIITGIGDYYGTIEVKFNIVKDEGDDLVVIAKRKQPMTVKPVLKKVSFKKLKKRAQTVKGAMVIKKNQGKITYKKLKGSSAKLTINKKTGKITIKKKTKKGIYKIKVKVTAAGNKLYKAGSKSVTVKIRVK